MFVSLFISMGKAMSSRGLKNLMHIFGTTLACLLYFSGYFMGNDNHVAALLLICLYIILGRLTSEMGYQVDRRLLEEKVQK